MQKNAVILLSGGLDSTTTLAFAKNKGYTCYALSFNYGQKNYGELQAAKKIAETLGVAEHRIFNLPIGELGGSALTDPDMEVPDHQEGNEIPTTYVPARNTVFLSVALGWAEIIQAQAIFIGVSAVDYSGYPDCRPEYIAAFQAMARLATKAGVSDQGCTIHTPLINLSKAQTVQLGQQLGVDYSLSVTCYQVDQDGRACGRCDSCHLRQQGFADAKLPDPTRYQTEIGVN